MQKGRAARAGAGMQIVNIMQCTELGGMEQSSFRLMSGLQHRGHRCSVVSLTPLGRLQPYLEAEGIAALGLSYRGRLGWRSFPDLRRVLRAQRADALIMTGSNLLAMLALGRLAKGKRLLAMHFHHGVRPAWQWNVFYRIASARFDAISYPSEFIRSEAVAIAPFAAGICHTVRNPLVTPDMAGHAQRQAARARLGLPAGVPLVGNAGWLIPRKRFDVFLQVAARVSAEMPAARFVIAGDGPEEFRLKALSESLGIADRVIWLGWVEDMHSLYLSLDTLLFNSDWDAWGNTPVEAMSHGVPVVASVLNGGLGEIISHPAYGTLLPTHDITELANAVLTQICGRGNHTGQSGRQRSIDMSDQTRIVGEVERLLGLAS